MYVGYEKKVTESRTYKIEKIKLVIIGAPKSKRDSLNNSTLFKIFIQGKKKFFLSVKALCDCLSWNLKKKFHKWIFRFWDDDISMVLFCKLSRV